MRIPSSHTLQIKTIFFISMSCSDESTLPETIVLVHLDSSLMSGVFDFMRSFQLTHGPHSQAASYTEAVELEEHDAFAIALRDARQRLGEKACFGRRERKFGVHETF